ncbi:MAG: VOC family protein [Verrucomicrobiales bacterium]|nr:VOC family protein [Verrucomicrobiales bacterium]
MSENENQQPKEDRSPGVFSWRELLTNDPAASKKFYGELFGWRAQEMDVGPTKYTFFSIGERPVAGLLTITPEMGEVPPNWLSYVTVENIAAAVEKARALGAHICKDITELPMGKFAVLTDPQGAGIALWEFAKQGCECAD